MTHNNSHPHWTYHITNRSHTHLYFSLKIVHTINNNNYSSHMDYQLLYFHMETKNPNWTLLRINANPNTLFFLSIYLYNCVFLHNLYCAMFFFCLPTPSIYIDSNLDSLTTSLFYITITQLIIIFPIISLLESSIFITNHHKHFNSSPGH